MMRSSGFGLILSLLLFVFGSTGCDGDDGDEQVCSPGQKKCDGNDVVTCNSSGTDWQFLMECGATGSCSAGSCEQDCIPDCDDKECGDDGCGGFCGTCPWGEQCTDGACVCTPDCEGKECGDDGCGTTCPGSCPTNETCCSGGCKGEVWTDPATALEWQVHASSDKVSHFYAGQYCDELVLGASSDWRVPSDEELVTLRSIWVQGCDGFCIEGPCGSYWAENNCDYSANSGIILDFAGVTGLECASKSSSHHVRCVR